MNLLEIPPVTKIILLHQIIGLGVQQIDSLSRFEIYFNFEKIFLQGQCIVSQIWRLITSLFFIKKMNFFVLFQIMFFYHMVKNLERGGFNRGSVDFLFLIIVILSIIYVFAWLLNINHLGLIFKYVLYYLYGRTNYQQIILINLIPIRAPFLIWFLFLIDWVMETPQVKNLMISILIGHTLFFLIKIYPNLYYTGNKKILDTPQFFIDMVNPYFNEDDRVQRDPQENLW